VTDRPNSCATLQMSSTGVCHEVNSGKCKDRHLGRNDTRRQLMHSCLESRSAEKDLGVVVDHKLNISQQCVLGSKEGQEPSGLH